MDLPADSIIWRLSIWCVQTGHGFESGDVGYVAAAFVQSHHRSMTNAELRENNVRTEQR